MKAAILAAFLLCGCATKCPDCLTMTKGQLVKALTTAWQHGYGKGFDDGEDAADLKKVRPI